MESHHRRSGSLVAPEKKPPKGLGASAAGDGSALAASSTLASGAGGGVGTLGAAHKTVHVRLWYDMKTVEKGASIADPWEGGWRT